MADFSYSFGKQINVILCDTEKIIGIHTDGVDFFFNAVILIRDGNTVIRAVCGLHTWGDSDALFPLWLDQIADKIA